MTEQTALVVGGVMWLGAAVLIGYGSFRVVSALLARLDRRRAETSRERTRQARMEAEAHREQARQVREALAAVSAEFEEVL
jgi:hypothetical protein